MQFGYINTTGAFTNSNMVTILGISSSGGGQVDISGALTTTGTINSNTFTSSGLQFGAAATATVQSAASQILTLQGATGLSLLVTSGNVTIGTSDTTGTLLVLDTKTDAGDPTGVNGGMYYNSNLGGLRCHENSMWDYCRDPRSLLYGYRIQEDFMNSSDNSNNLTVGDLGWDTDEAGGAAFTGKAAATSAHRPGVYWQSVDAVSSRASVFLGGRQADGTEQVMIGGDRVVIDMGINIETLATSLQDYTYRFGLCDSSSADCTDGIYFEYDRSVSTAWQTATASNSTRTKNTTSSTVATGWHNFRIVINANGSSPTSVDYYVDGTLIGSNTTNIPNGSARVTTPMFQFIKTVGSSAINTYIDFFYMYSSFSSR
jgi:hypothetical protein